MLLLLTGARRTEITQANGITRLGSAAPPPVPLSKSGKPRAHRPQCPPSSSSKRSSRIDGTPYISPSPGDGPAVAVARIFPGTGSASAPGSASVRRTISATRSRASSSTRASRFTSCRGCRTQPRAHHATLRASRAADVARRRRGRRHDRQRRAARCGARRDAACRRAGRRKHLRPRPYRGDPTKRMTGMQSRMTVES